MYGAFVEEYYYNRLPVAKTPSVLTDLKLIRKLQDIQICKATTS